MRTGAARARRRAPSLMSWKLNSRIRRSSRRYNVDKEGDLAVEKSIFVVPTIILEKDGVEVKKWMGVTSKEELTQALNEALK